MNRPIAVGLLVLCTALWGLAFVFQKGAMEHMEPLTFAGVRYFLGSFLVLPLAIWEFRRRTAAGVTITRGQWIRIGVLSLAFFLGVWLQQVALLTTSVTNGGFITSLYVIFTPVLVLLATVEKGVFRDNARQIAASLAMFAAVLATGSRTPLVALVIAALWLCFICWNRRSALLLASMLIAGTATFALFTDKIIARGSSFRIELWQLTLGKVAEHPWIGHGYNAKLSLDPGVGYTLQEPHSFALGVLYYVGIIGLLPWLFFLAWGLISSQRHRVQPLFIIASAWLAFGLATALCLIHTGYSSVSAVVKAELFPTAIRAMGVALPYAIANTVFGGTAEYVALWFKTQRIESGFYIYVSVMMSIALAISLRIRNTNLTSLIEED